MSIGEWISIGLAGLGAGIYIYAHMRSDIDALDSYPDD